MGDKNKRSLPFEDVFLMQCEPQEEIHVKGNTSKAARLCAMEKCCSFVLFENVMYDNC